MNLKLFINKFINNMKGELIPEKLKPRILPINLKNKKKQKSNFQIRPKYRRIINGKKKIII